MRASEKTIDAFYRGRRLPEIYGKLGYEKYQIADEFRERAEACGLNCDIETDYAKRVYGEEWFERLASARFTLGTESGASVFDFDGSIQREIEKFKEKNPDITFNEIFQEYLH